MRLLANHDSAKVISHGDLLTEETFDQGIQWLSEGHCPICGAELERINDCEGNLAGLCTASRISFRLTQGEHGPVVNSCREALLTLVSCSSEGVEE